MDFRPINLENLISNSGCIRLGFCYVPKFHVSYHIIFIFKEGDPLAVNLDKYRTAPHGWCLSNYVGDVISQGLSILTGFSLCGTRSEFTYTRSRNKFFLSEAYSSKTNLVHTAKYQKCF